MFKKQKKFNKSFYNNDNMKFAKKFDLKGFL